MAVEAATPGTDVVLVDEFDFLVPVWGGDVSGLLEMVRKLSVSETQTTIGFVMKTVPAVEAFTLRDRAGNRRILRWDEIQALP